MCNSVFFHDGVLPSDELPAALDDGLLLYMRLGKVSVLLYRYFCAHFAAPFTTAPRAKEIEQRLGKVQKSRQNRVATSNLRRKVPQDQQCSD